MKEEAIYGKYASENIIAAAKDRRYFQHLKNKPMFHSLNIFINMATLNHSINTEISIVARLRKYVHTFIPRRTFTFIPRNLYMKFRH